MPRKIRQLKSDLRKSGFVELSRRGKGSHTIWEHRHSGTMVTISGRDGDDADHYQERDVREALAKAQQLL